MNTIKLIALTAKIIAATAVALVSAALLGGCSSTPTKLDTALANIQTNYVPQLVLKTNLVTVLQTNTVTATVFVTNSVGVVVPQYVTNLTTLTSYQTNVVAVTNIVPQYVLVPNATSTGAAGIAGAVTNLISPGTGGLVSAGLLALLSIGLGIRNRTLGGQNDALSQASGTLAQIIETGREVLASTPQGAAAESAFTTWMVGHQADTQTIGLITQIVQSATNNQQAQAAAAQIMALVTPPTATAAAAKT